MKKVIWMQSPGLQIHWPEVGFVDHIRPESLLENNSLISHAIYKEKGYGTSAHGKPYSAQARIRWHSKTVCSLEYADDRPDAYVPGTVTITFEGKKVKSVLWRKLNGTASKKLTSFKHILGDTKWAHVPSHYVKTGALKAGTKFNANKQMNWAKQAEMLIECGATGERIVLALERARVEKDFGKKKAASVKKVHDSEGYDILSVHEDGGPLFVEVKTTTSNDTNEAFFASTNEIRFSKENNSRYKLIRIFALNAASATYDFWEQLGSLDSIAHEPTLYRFNPKSPGGK